MKGEILLWCEFWVKKRNEVKWISELSVWGAQMLWIDIIFMAYQFDWRATSSVGFYLNFFLAYQMICEKNIYLKWLI